MSRSRSSRFLAIVGSVILVTLAALAFRLTSRPVLGIEVRPGARSISIEVVGAPPDLVLGVFGPAGRLVQYLPVPATSPKARWDVTVSPGDQYRLDFLQGHPPGSTTLLESRSVRAPGRVGLLGLERTLEGARLWLSCQPPASVGFDGSEARTQVSSEAQAVPVPGALLAPGGGSPALVVGTSSGELVKIPLELGDPTGGRATGRLHTLGLAGTAADLRRSREAPAPVGARPAEIVETWVIGPLPGSGAAIRTVLEPFFQMPDSKFLIGVSTRPRSGDPVLRDLMAKDRLHVVLPEFLIRDFAEHAFVMGSRLTEAVLPEGLRPLLAPEEGALPLIVPVPLADISSVLPILRSLGASRAPIEYVSAPLHADSFTEWDRMHQDLVRSARAVQRPLAVRWVQLVSRMLDILSPEEDARVATLGFMRRYVAARITFPGAILICPVTNVLVGDRVQLTPEWAALCHLAWLLDDTHLIGVVPSGREATARLQFRAQGWMARFESASRRVVVMQAERGHGPAQFRPGRAGILHRMAGKGYAGRPHVTASPVELELGTDPVVYEELSEVKAAGSSSSVEVVSIPFLFDR